jgi:hypothetical protein
MEEQDPIQLNLEISADDASSGELDELARRLLAELRETDVESVDLVSAGSAPSGAKAAEAITAGAIALSILPAALPKLIEFVQSWAMRGQGRRQQTDRRLVERHFLSRHVHVVLPGLGASRQLHATGQSHPALA